MTTSVVFYEEAGMKRLDMHGCKHAHFDGQSAKTNVAALIDEHAKAWEQQHKRQAMTS